MDVVKVCVAAYLHVSMCCTRTRELLQSPLVYGATVMAEAVVVIGPTTTASLGNARTSM